MITVKENVLNVDEFNSLYDAVGWGAYEKEVSLKALQNTFYSVSIYDGDSIIGYGRLIGDDICFLYIHDVMVLPEYQSQKIGTMMKNLLQKVSTIQKENPSLRLYLGASLGKEGFYRKFGFLSREEAGLGSGMIYQGEEKID